MMQEPWFWRSKSITAKAVAISLTPLSFLYDLGQRARWKLTTPHTTSVPIICIGNATLGGVGKTPFSIALHQLLQNAGYSSHFLTRGYGGRETGPTEIDVSAHDASDIGDEALLLARQGPTWVSKDRRDGAIAAVHTNDGTPVNFIIMDDGFQNPTIKKTVSILLIDADTTAINERIFPAGPFREPLARAQSRADITVYVGQTKQRAQAAVDLNNTIFSAWLEPCRPLQPKRVLAFSGIGRPEKFFDLLQQSGFDVAHQAGFPDHHPFTVQNLSALQQLATSKNATLITTEKDHVRIPSGFQDKVETFPVRMNINKPALLVEMIKSKIDRATSDR